MLSELRTAFQIGFVIFLPFLLIDLVVAAILMALGMIMLPPTTISLPLKILLFLLINGWGLRRRPCWAVIVIKSRNASTLRRQRSGDASELCGRSRGRAAARRKRAKR